MSSETESKKLFRRVTRTYQVALLFIASCAIASGVTICSMVRNKSEFNQLINISGRQRMLSQRIAFCAHEYVSDKGSSKQDYAQALRAAADLFEKSHRTLTLGNPSLSAKQRDLYFGEQDLDGSVCDYLANVNLLLALDGHLDEQEDVLEKLELQASGGLLTNLDRVVKQIETEADRYNDFLFLLEFCFLAATLLTILAEARFIFSPLAHRISQITNELSGAIEKVRWAADHDELTGLANRRCFYGRVHERIAEGAQVSILHLDLDKFKSVNDTFGHFAGDAVLKAVAERLQNHREIKTLAARVGGDEFVLLVEQAVTEAELANSAQVIIDAISEPIEHEARELSVGCSIGIAVSSRGKGHADGVLYEADIALNEAKKLGRGRYEFISPEISARYRQYDIQRSCILAGIGKGEFLPFFQPQVNERTGQVVGVEVLTRWKQADGSYLSAGSFIATAEEFNLLDQIEQPVIEQGLETFQDWQQRHIPIPHMSINVSMAKLADESFVEWLEGKVHALQIKPSQVSIEILETVLLDGNNRNLIENINTLRRHGFLIELDDFGTGHASINALLELEVDQVKFDRSLIRDIVHDPSSLILVEGLVRLIEKLDLKMLVEGVETVEQLRCLQTLHDFTYQGYYFAKPMSSAALEDWVLRNEQQTERASESMAAAVMS